MKRSELEHILRASKGVTGETEFIVIGWCLEPHDLAFSKLAARREKDIAFVRALLRHQMIRLADLRRRIDSAADPALRERLSETLAICQNK